MLKELGADMLQSSIPRGEIFVTTKLYRGFKPKKELSESIQESLDQMGLGEFGF
jgi:diketogulonate reductase-like aldo/keto reductase